MTHDELTRLAFIYAQQDRESYAECWPDGSDERKQAQQLANTLKEYRLKKWGRSKLEAMLACSRPVSLQELTKPRRKAGR